LRTAGISCGGPLDPVKGIVLNPPNLPGWDRTPLRAMIADGLHLDPRRVHLENDANAGALAELRFGAARGRRHAIFLTMSTGIGGGLILDGRLYRGATSNAGEVGHQVVLPGGPLCGCGNRGCLEAVASGSGIAARLQDRFHTLSPRLRQAAGADGRLTAEHLIQAVRDGDGSAIEFFEETVTLLARGIANLVFVINPEIVILGTIGWHAGPTLLDSLREQVGRMCWPVLTAGLEIVASPLGLRLEQLSGLAVALEAEADAP
jgi:glucokinase